MPDFEIERRLFGAGLRTVAGLDEAGRGALCGPVIAAAVIFPPSWLEDGAPAWLAGVDDSKRLSPRQRERLNGPILAEAAAVGVGAASCREVDGMNVLRAAQEAMHRALAALSPPPDAVIVDGRPLPGLDRPQEAVIGGDRKSLSVAAASIVAKVLRDRLMTAAAGRYPGYGLERHKGYGTRAHYEALAILGPSPFHRRSFRLQYRPGLFPGP